MARSCSSAGWLCRMLSSTAAMVPVSATVAAGSWASAAWAPREEGLPQAGGFGEGGLHDCGRTLRSREDAEVGGGRTLRSGEDAEVRGGR